MKKLILGLMLGVALVCGISFADTHYVSPYGSDTYPYTSWETAADSIQKGIDAASSGDTVRVGAGTYYEGVVLKPYITLLGAGMDSCIIHGIVPGTPPCVVKGGDSSIIEGFHMLGFGHDSEDPGGIFSTLGYNLKKISNNRATNCYCGVFIYRNTVVSNNVLGDNRVGIITGLAGDGLIINNTITHNELGINLFFGSGYRIVKNIISYTGSDNPIGDYIMDSIVIENNLITGRTGEFTNSGIHLSNGGSSKARIVNNTISFEHKYRGISVDNISAEIKNNIVANSLSGLQATEPTCYVTAYYNDLWNNIDNYYILNDATIDTSLGGNIYQDPMFVGDGDYHLQYGSPCIDAGDPNIKDPDSSRSDMGCYGGTWGETYLYQDYPPRAPDSLKATSSDTLIILSWKPNTESDLSHYRVYKDVVSGFIPDSSNIVGEVEKDSSVFWDFDVILQQTYYYLVSAWDLTGNESDYSHELPVQATDVDNFTEEGPPMPRMYQVRQNYPNPFNPSTTIVYYLPDVGYQPAEVEIVIYNLLGQKVRTLVKEREYPGEHKVTWDGKDDKGNDLSSGIYFYKLTFSGVDLYPLVKPKKMVLIR
jgi:hypothetical protein